MGIFKKGLFLAGTAGAGYLGYKMVNKTKMYKEDFERPITFGGKEEVIKTDFKGATYGILCGGLSLDLAEATMSADEAILKLSGEFCGISVVVPEDWNVKVDGIAEKGGISVKVDYDEEDTKSKRLIIQYDIKYGGLEIKYATEIDDEPVEVDIEDVADVAGE
ncbi:MAG: hypothetical protein PF505_11895 [Vallitaleaceae bacterium]|jgi:predicted membrane protein|nr:hypothetical protein [Vallitaleaceae bacterium]